MFGKKNKNQKSQEKDKKAKGSASKKDEDKQIDSNQNNGDQAQQNKVDQDNVVQNIQSEAEPAKPAFTATDLMLGRVSIISENKNQGLNDSTKIQGNNENPEETLNTKAIETKRSNFSTRRNMLTTDSPDQRDLSLQKDPKALDRNNQFEKDINVKAQQDNDLKVVECESLQIPAPSPRSTGRKSKNASVLKSFKKSYLEDANEIPKKNPKFDGYRESVLHRPSHYNASICVNEGGDEQTPAGSNPDAAEKDFNVKNPPPPANAELENEKRGYMIKEQEFYKSLKDVQTYYLEICICLMQMGKFMFFLTAIYALVCMKWWGCGFGDCENYLICCIHYVKFVQALTVYSQYSHNITEKQPSHPIATINAYFTIFLYYICLYWYKDILVEDENMIHFISIYLVIDTFMLIISFFAIKKVKVQCQALINNKKYKEYSQEAEIALADVLYLPEEYESEEEEV